MMINLKHVLLWSSARDINKIKIISSMYVWIFLVPIVVKVLEKIESEVTLNIFSHSFDFVLELPFSWLAFYFSALFFVIANLIFRFKCPGIIKDHPTYNSFVEAKKPMWHLDMYVVDIGRTPLQYVPELKEGLAKYGGEPPQGKEFEESYFWHLFSDAERIRKKSRVAVYFSYIIGFLLILFVLLQNLFWVVRHVITSF